MLRECATQEGREGRQAFELKIHINEMGGPKQVHRPSRNQKTQLAGSPLWSQGKGHRVAFRNKGARLLSSILLLFTEPPLMPGSLLGAWDPLNLHSGHMGYMLWLLPFYRRGA